MNEYQSRALDLMIESILKPDSKLRGCAFNQFCEKELMGWRELMLDTLYHYKKTGEVPTQVPTIKEKNIPFLSTGSDLL
jgi:hypothetical protein